MTDYGHDIEKYLKGELTPAERHALEKKALNDPFLADALEGAEQIKAADFSKDVAQLNERLAGKKAVTVWMWAARIAAGLAFIVVSTFVVWSLIGTEPQQDLAMEKNEPAAAPPPTSDSVTSETGKLSSSPVEQPTAGPTSRDKVATKQPTSPLKTEAKPQGITGGAQAKNEPVTEAIAVTEAEEKAEELKAQESIAQSKSLSKEAESYRAKAEDDKDDMGTDRKKKSAPSEKEAVPAAAGGRADYASSNIIQGQVTSAEDSSPLPGVNVVIKNSTIGTTTDAGGNYQVKVAEPDPTLVYSFIGFQTTEVKVSQRQQVNVAMPMDETQLSEVVTMNGVKSAGESLPPTVDLAHPEIGNRAFKQYLERNIRYPEQAKTNKVAGLVTVEFTIEPNGTLTNFTVIRGIGNGCDEELIRLIKEGPKWIPTKKGNVPVQDKAKVQLKFKLPD